MSDPRLMRLQLYMARCGVGSRRYCEGLIQKKRVQVNGHTATLGSKVSQGDRVRLDGRNLQPIRKQIYLAVHKPRGYLCSTADRTGRPLVSDLFKDEAIQGQAFPRLFHVGRLDLMSSGLIFYTNDGDFAHLVSHPSLEIEKEYLLETREDLPESVLHHYQDGVVIHGRCYRLRRYRYRPPKRVHLVLVEGKNREIRRVCRHFRLNPRRIHRTRIGCVSLKNLPVGIHRPLSTREVNWFFGHIKREAL